MNKVLFREVYVGLMLIDESGTTLRRKYMNITMLGTGNALVTECYNTCFILQEDNEYFLVDGGGGSTIPVSYTHLDVYKRQDCSTALIAEMINQYQR